MNLPAAESPNLPRPLGDEALLVVAAYSRATGIVYRGVIPPPAVATQALEFVRAGYSIHGLELTIAWVQRQIAEKKSGFRETSLRWHNLFGAAGDGLQRYAELLHFAQKAWDGGWRPVLKAKGEGRRAKEKTAPKPADETPGLRFDDPAVESAAAELFAKFGKGKR